MAYEKLCFEPEEIQKSKEIKRNYLPKVAKRIKSHIIVTKKLLL